MCSRMQPRRVYCTCQSYEFFMISYCETSNKIGSNLQRIEMDDRGEVSQILSGITFDGNNIFRCGKNYL